MADPRVSETVLNLARGIVAAEGFYTQAAVSVAQALLALQRPLCPDRPAATAAPLAAELEQYIPDLRGRVDLPAELVRRVINVLRAP